MRNKCYATGFRAGWVCLKLKILIKSKKSRYCIPALVKLPNFQFLLYISVDAVGYCAANPSDIVPMPDNCAQYYNCTEMNSRIGGHVMECKYPDLFSTQTRSCQSFETVHCTKRMEPQAPCMLNFFSYIQTVSLSIW